MKAIPLTRGQHALVDDEDWAWLSEYRWCAQWSVSVKGYYAACSSNWGRGGHVKPMHRRIWECHYGRIPPGLEIDHKSGETLDNQKTNLRLATHRLNSLNTHPKNGAKRTLPIGVYRVARTAGAYAVMVAKRSFGTFHDLEAARVACAKARNDAIEDELRKVKVIVQRFKGVLVGPLPSVPFRLPCLVRQVRVPQPVAEESEEAVGCGLDVEHFLSRLTFRQRWVVKLRYGIGDLRSHTLRETGEAVGISPERVRQVEAKAIRIMQWWAERQ